MQEVIILGNIEVQVRVSSKAKRIAMRIMPCKTVELILPRARDFDRAHKFLLEKELWLKNKLSRIKDIDPLEVIPKTISILGKEYQLILGDITISKPIEISNNQIIISHVIPQEKIGLVLIPLLKKMIRDEITKYALSQSEALKVKYKSITIRDTKSRWGSCSSSGSLSFSWRLILAPRYVMEYVVIHELCHLIEMNHSHRFWKLVNQFCPEHHAARSWVKKYGNDLHRFLPI